MEKSASPSHYYYGYVVVVVGIDDVGFFWPGHSMTLSVPPKSKKVEKNAH